MIDPSTLHFLIDLSLNNHKTWFEDNRKAYEAARADFTEFIQDVIDTFGKTDPAIRNIRAKDCLFRINRDVRFSKNKNPYKNNFGASINAGGRKSMDQAGYYFHLEPDNSFTGGGLYDPSPEKLLQIRQKIQSDHSNFKKILGTPSFRTVYGDLSRDDHYTLKRVPKGFDQQDPAAEYLKLKSYIGMIRVEDDTLVSKDLKTKTVNAFKALQPVVDFING